MKCIKKVVCADVLMRNNRNVIIRDNCIVGCFEKVYLWIMLLFIIKEEEKRSASKHYISIYFIRWAWYTSKFLFFFSKKSDMSSTVIAFKTNWDITMLWNKRRENRWFIVTILIMDMFPYISLGFCRLKTPYLLLPSKIQKKSLPIATVSASIPFSIAALLWFHFIYDFKA